MISETSQKNQTNYREVLSERNKINRSFLFPTKSQKFQNNTTHIVWKKI